MKVHKAKCYPCTVVMSSSVGVIFSKLFTLFYKVKCIFIFKSVKLHLFSKLINPALRHDSLVELN